MRPYVLMALAACTTAPDKRSGYISLTSQQLGSTGGASYVVARFFTTEFPELVSTSTPCELDQYNSMQFPDGDFDAGVISISGIPTPVRLTPEPSGDYVSYAQYSDLTRPLFTGGEEITVAASGHNIPAFAEQLVAPAKIVVTSPTPLPDSELSIPIHQDLTVAWTGGAGLVQVMIGSISNGHIALCRFPAADGSGVIPHTVLEDISRGGSADFAIDSVDFLHVPLGDWRVDISATFNGVWASNDTLASGPVLLQD